MRSFRFSVVPVVFAVMYLGGCAESSLCPRPIGKFTGTFAQVSGNCPNVMSRDLEFETGETTVMDQINTLSDSVETVVNLIGCTVVVEQSISTPAEKRPVAHFEGNLAVENENVLAGRVSYQEFLPDGVSEACRSELEVSYVKQGSGSVAQPGAGNAEIGAAAAAALQATAQ
jgi:hypothetical protein